MIVSYRDSPKAVVRTFEDFGFRSYDLASIPRRLCVDPTRDALVEVNVYSRDARNLDSPAGRLFKGSASPTEGALSASDRALARLYSAFLIAEDPQRRLEVRKAATLMHQVSLVQHILSTPDLRKVLIGDEVGLGKTIEAGLIIRELIHRKPGLRVLYLAPARLVPNVAREFREKLDINARTWVAGPEADARLESDPIVVASMHRAVFDKNLEKVAASGPWDVVIVDECHHLSDWAPSGGSPNRWFRLTKKLVENQPPDGRLILLSGTPHQGSEARFANILRLLSDDGENVVGARGRVIFRTKDRVRDWRGQPLFPRRDVLSPHVVDLGPEYENWYRGISELYETADPRSGRARAVSWAKGQALQWAASSVQAGLGFLVRLAMRRLRWTLEHRDLKVAMTALRPYRGGRADEPVEQLYARISKQVRPVAEAAPEDEDATDLEDGLADYEEVWIPDAEMLGGLLREGVGLLQSNAATSKWDKLCELLELAGDDKVVLFAQPVETVCTVADMLEKRFGQRPSMIIGNQSDEERTAEVARFQAHDGTRFLVSSKAGGEGLNMQKAHRLIHLDIPWNPMDLEQRIGRVHRFGSRKTVVIDTVVARGSREVDMYKIARDKLALVARQLDPDQFEELFGRVMSLVPPKELEWILGDVGAGSHLSQASANRIGELVQEGYKSWSRFDSTYRKQADEIRNAPAGAATWADVLHFLERHCGAKPESGATFGTFTFEDNEIVDIEENVPAIEFQGQTFSCGDTGGLSAFNKAGIALPAIGLGVPALQAVLENAFVTEDGGAAVAWLRRTAKLGALVSGPGVGLVHVFLRQSLQSSNGAWQEVGCSLCVFVHDCQSGPRMLPSPEAATLIRECQRAPRLRIAPNWVADSRLIDVEADMAAALKRPSEPEIAEGIRYAIWPVALICLVSDRTLA